MDKKISEAGHQTLVVCWAKKAYLRGRVELDLLMHIPNGEKRDAATASKLKRLGVRPGVPDLCLPIMRGGHGALWIEMKTDGGRVSDDQDKWHLMLRWAGHKVVVAWTWQEAIDAIKDYLDLDLDGSGSEWPDVSKEMNAMAQRLTG